MESKSSELTSRYYAAEKTAWGLSGVLLIWLFFGLEENQAIPYLGITLENPKHFTYVLLVFLLVISAYMKLEWHLSSKEARAHPLSRLRAFITFVLIAAVFWFFIPVVSEGTFLAGVSPAWYLTFAGIGFLMGMLASVMIFVTLAIRTPEESKRIKLQRISVATSSMYKGGTLVILTLLIANYILYLKAPEPFREIATYITAIFYVFFILTGLIPLFLERDEDGDRIPFKDVIARFREVVDTHDYEYKLHREGPRELKGIETDHNMPASKLQEEMRKNRSQPDISIDEVMDFRLKTLSEIELGFCKKNDNKDDNLLGKSGVKIRTLDGEKRFIKVMLIPKDKNENEREVSLPIELVQKYLDEYLNRKKDLPAQSPQRAISYALNEAAKNVLMDKAKCLLYHAIFAGQKNAVTELIKIGSNVNEKGANGWTPLLAATAQGYPEIVIDLLNAGADPDVGQFLRITPLMYAARYSNSEIARIFIDHGADINLKDVKYETALMRAVRSESEEIVDILIQAGAKVTIKNRKKETALVIAQKLGLGKIAKKLRKATRDI